MENSNKSFSITREESEQLMREYEINEILKQLYKASSIIEKDVTISEAINILSDKTRFFDEIKSGYFNKLCT